MSAVGCACSRRLAVRRLAVTAPAESPARAEEGVARVLERRAHVPVLDLEHRVRGRPEAEAQAFEEQVVAAAAKRLRAERVSDAHREPYRFRELVLEARDLE